MFIINLMPNIFHTVLVRRFLAHSLEILVIFAISITSLSLIQFFLSYFNYNLDLSKGFLGDYSFVKQEVVTSYEEGSVNLTEIAKDYPALKNEKAVSILSGLVVLFTVYYFVFTAFNFFLSFTVLYPNNNYKVNIAYRLFGFSHYDFGKKKISHMRKSLKMLKRELVFVFSIYGLFFIFTLFNANFIVNFFANFMGGGESLMDILLIVFYLFCIFVLPSFILSLVTLKISKGKQLFWDFISGVTLK